MILVILFWVLFLLWAIDSFASFLPSPANRIILVVLMAIIGLRIFGNPFNT